MIGNIIVVTINLEPISGVSFGVNLALSGGAFTMFDYQLNLIVITIITSCVAYYDYLTPFAGTGLIATGCKDKDF